MEETEEDYKTRVTSYKNLLKGITLFSNADTITAVANGASQTIVPEAVDYKYVGGASITCSSIAILTILSICLKKLYDEKYRDKLPVSVPSTYLVFLTISCILSIAGSSLLIHDQNIHNGISTKSDLHVAGALLFTFAKIMNPIFASTLVVADSLEHSAPPVNQQPDPERGDLGNPRAGAGAKPPAKPAPPVAKPMAKPPAQEGGDLNNLGAGGGAKPPAKPAPMAKPPAPEDGDLDNLGAGGGAKPSAKSAPSAAKTVAKPPAPTPTDVDDNYEDIAGEATDDPEANLLNTPKRP